ncbi:asparagine synthetase B family protein [Myxococcus sp. Y35]|uniref:asparagine synthetase B family protein n=1 Tax=Pseudomyxococcus flavus TaxID=3115648 RepID=UPI003CF9544E
MDSTTKNLWCWAGRGVGPSGFTSQDYRWSEGAIGAVLTSSPRGHRCASATSRSGRQRILFEGSIYNAEELGSALRGSAHAPSPEELTDASLLLALFLEHGPGGLNLVNGPFAFVIWDETRQRLSLGRDRFGMNTLFWREDAQGLSMASRMTPLLAAPGARRRLDKEGALDFLINGLTDQRESTLFADIQQLPAGSVMEFDLPAWKPGLAARQIRDWYSLPEPGGVLLSAQEAVAEFRRLLSDAIRLRWRSPEPKALLLSGGLDSSAIAGLVATGPSSGPLLQTYKAYFDIPRYDQPECVSSVVERTGAVHRGISIGPPELLAYREQLLHALEQPYERSIISAHWAVCQLIATDGIRVTLDGLGADEQLGGYRPWVRSFGPLQRGEDVRGLPFISSSRPPESFEQGADLGRLFSWLSRESLDLAIQKITRENALAIRSFGELCRYHIRHGALPLLLMFNRCIGAAFDQESRSPFMDHRLVEFSLGLGSHHKVVGEQTKYVLRKAVEDLVPGIVARHVNKESYVDLEVSWLRGSGLEQLRSEAVRTAREWPALFSLDAMEVPAEGQEPSRLTLLRLWRITCFGAWARQFGVQ